MQKEIKTSSELRRKLQSIGISATGQEIDKLFHSKNPGLTRPVVLAGVIKVLDCQMADILEMWEQEQCSLCKSPATGHVTVASGDKQVTAAVCKQHFVALTGSLPPEKNA